MSSRRPIRPLPATEAEAIALLFELVADLFAAVEAINGAPATHLPADYRFEQNPDGSITIRRISTLGSAVITPPM